MIHCRDCEHWVNWRELARPDPASGIPRGIRYASTDSPYDHMCALVVSEDRSPTHPRGLAHTFETDDCFSGLATSPDFGCVQGEPRKVDV